jgi:protein SCO1
MTSLLRAAAALSVISLATAAAAADLDAPARPGPAAAEGADLQEHLGAPVDRSLELTDMDGRKVHLGDYFDGQRPVLVVLAYYRCPTLCGLVLRGAVEGLSELGYALGDQYRAVTVSFDPRDDAASARKKRKSTLAALSHAPAREGEWPFLVGDERSTKALADEIGFRYAYDERSDQYAHPAAIFALTPDGRISRYLYGVRFSALDLRLALVEAGAGRIGTLADRVLLTCYRWDPATRRYGPFVTGFLRIGAAVILGVVVVLLAVMFHGERRRRRALEMEERR